jgi:hypothetical protein
VPNVVNASDINEMPPNTWYVEGSILDRFLEGTIYLKKPKSNKILLAVNSPVRPETYNAVNAARHTIGCEIEVMELKEELRMFGRVFHNSGAEGDVWGWVELCEQVKDYNFDALAIATKIEVDKKVILNYLKNGGINPWGGIEAETSKRIASKINKPVAHAPIENEDPEINTFNEVVDPRMGAELISTCYIHSVFKGLHKAPRINKNGWELGVKDIDCLISPIGCWGPPHEACAKVGIPIIGVEENKPIVMNGYIQPIMVKNYLEAAGYVQLLKEGMTLESVRSK